MTKPILLADCYLDSPGAARNFVPLLRGRDVVVVRPAHEPWRGRADEFAAIIISGSAASIVAPPAWERPLEDLVHQAADADIPTLGVCFGHQVIARALFGTGAVCNSQPAELGWFEVARRNDDPLFAGVEPRFHTFVSHREEVDTAASGMRVLASTPDCANQAFRVADHRLWGVQFHAEIGVAEATKLVSDRAKSKPEQQIDVGTTLAGAVDSTELAQRLIDNFMAEL